MAAENQQQFDVEVKDKTSKADEKQQKSDANVSSKGSKAGEQSEIPVHSKKPKPGSGHVWGVPFSSPACCWDCGFCNEVSHSTCSNSATLLCVPKVEQVQKNEGRHEANDEISKADEKKLDVEANDKGSKAGEQSEIPVDNKKPKSGSGYVWGVPWSSPACCWDCGFCNEVSHSTCLDGATLCFSKVELVQRNEEKHEVNDEISKADEKLDVEVNDKGSKAGEQSEIPVDNKKPEPGSGHVLGVPWSSPDSCLDCGFYNEVPHCTCWNWKGATTPLCSPKVEQVQRNEEKHEVNDEISKADEKWIIDDEKWNAQVNDGVSMADGEWVEPGSGHVLGVPWSSPDSCSDCGFYNEVSHCTCWNGKGATTLLCSPKVEQVQRNEEKHEVNDEISKADEKWMVDDEKWNVEVNDEISKADEKWNVEVKDKGSKAGEQSKIPVDNKKPEPSSGHVWGVPWSSPDCCWDCGFCDEVSHRACWHNIQMQKAASKKQKSDVEVNNETSKVDEKQQKSDVEVNDETSKADEKQQKSDSKVNDKESIDVERSE